MRGNDSSLPNLNKCYSDIVLKDKENLSLHFDCMDAFGNIITVDDVDDLGGSVNVLSVFLL